MYTYFVNLSEKKMVSNNNCQKLRDRNPSVTTGYVNRKNYKY